MGDGNGLIETMSANPIFFSIIALSLCETLCSALYIHELTELQRNPLSIVVPNLKIKKLRFSKTKHFTQRFGNPVCLTTEPRSVDAGLYACHLQGIR